MKKLHSRASSPAASSTIVIKKIKDSLKKILLVNPINVK